MALRMPDSDGLRWIPGRGVPHFFYGLFGSIVAFVGLLDAVIGYGRGWVELIRAFELNPTGGGWLLTGLVYLLSVGGPLAVVVGALVTVPTTLGIGPTGIRVVTRIDTRDIPWSRLQAGKGRPTSEWAVLQPTPESPGKLGRAIWVTKEQALTILQTPEAPAALFPPKYRAWLGLR